MAAFRTVLRRTDDAQRRAYGQCQRRARSVDVRICRVYTQPVSEDINALLARCDGFDWDAGNALKVVARHNVEPGECEQAFFSETFVVDADEKHSRKEQRWRALGTTLAGRHLYLVFTVRGARIRVITARDMNRKERRTYDQAKARTQEDPDVHV